MSATAVVCLGDVASFIRGITFKPTDVVSFGTAGSVACFRTKNVQADIDLSDVLALPSNFARKSDKLVREGDLLVSTANSWNLVGKCSWVPVLPWSATIGGFIAALRPNEQKINPRFLYWWFSRSETQERVRGCARQTTNISNLSIDQCLALELPLPPLAEQQRIAAILDQADALRRNRREVLQRVSALQVAVFEDMFGPAKHRQSNWPTKELREVVRSGTIITYGMVQAGEEFEGGVPYIRTGDIVGGEIMAHQLRRADPAIAAKFDRARVETGDIVMSIRATVGTTAMVQPELDGANLTQGTAKIAPGPLTDGRYLLAYLRSDPAQKWIAKQVKGATFREITLTRLREMPIIVPPLELQRRFSVRAKQLTEVEVFQRGHLAHLEALFASLQDRAFRGDL